MCLSGRTRADLDGDSSVTKMFIIKKLNDKEVIGDRHFPQYANGLRLLTHSS